jgi:hypothetical protein
MRGQPAGGRGFSAYRIFYGLIVLLIVCVWIYAFRAYFAHYDSLHPEIAWAVPWVQVDVVRVDGILLWDEEVVPSPRDGTVQYPMGRGPVRVPRGAIVARVSSGRDHSDVKAKSDGYFIAGLDGSEEKWRYSSLWPGTKELPSPPPVKMIDDGARVKKGERIGKIAPQPQELRLIGYVDATDEMKDRLSSNKIKAKMDMLDTPSAAAVRVFETFGHRAKIYLNVPWFPRDILMSRQYSLLIETGETSGVAVPESAVTVRDGRRGAFVIRGADAVFVEVKGRVIDGSRFLVTEGLKLGDAVAIDAGSSREGRVRLW